MIYVAAYRQYFGNVDKVNRIVDHLGHNLLVPFGTLYLLHIVLFILK